MNKLLIDFLRTGKLNQIHLGMDEDDIFKIVGVSESEYDDLEKDLNIFAYGNLQLTTYKKKLTQILIKFLSNKIKIPGVFGKIRRVNRKMN